MYKEIVENRMAAIAAEDTLGSECTELGEGVKLYREKMIFDLGWEKALLQYSIWDKTEWVDGVMVSRRVWYNWIYVVKEGHKNDICPYCGGDNDWYGWLRRNGCCKWCGAEKLD